MASQRSDAQVDDFIQEEAYSARCSWQEDRQASEGVSEDHRASQQVQKWTEDQKLGALTVAAIERRWNIMPTDHRCNPL